MVLSFINEAIYCRGDAIDPSTVRHIASGIGGVHQLAADLHRNN